MQTPEQAAAEVVLMTKQHHYIQKELGGKLIFAPIELAGRDLSILDVGCGSGRLESHKRGTAFTDGFIPQALYWRTSTAKLEQDPIWSGSTSIPPLWHREKLLLGKWASN
jgi:hypothetical protein